MDWITVGELRRLLANMPEEAVVEVSERGYLTVTFHPDGRRETVPLDDIQKGETYEAYTTRKEKEKEPAGRFAAFLDGLLFLPGERERAEAERNLAAMDRAAELPRVGALIRLARPVDRFPHFRCMAGERGTVVEVGPDVYAVEMDDPPPGSEEWAGVIHWTDRAEFLADIEPAHLGRDPQE
jgi:hypothetical protein